jgi:hypothetical protein
MEENIVDSTRPTDNDSMVHNDSNVVNHDNIPEELDTNAPDGEEPDDEEPDFEPATVGEEGPDFEPAAEGDIDAMQCLYVNNLFNNSSLHILQAARVAKSYNDNGVLGLFTLFITNSWFENMRIWTNKRIVEQK